MRSLAITSFIAAVAGFGLASLFLDPSESVEPVAGETFRPSAGGPRPSAGSSLDEPADLAGMGGFSGDLAAALKTDDPFLAAARARDWLRSATAADFQALAQDPTNFPQPSSKAARAEFEEAFFTAFITRWLEVDPDALAAAQRLQDQISKSRRDDSRGLIRAFARARPALLLQAFDASAEPKLQIEQQVAFSTLARQDLGRARAFLEQLPENLRPPANAAIIAGIAASDPLTALELTRDLNKDLAWGVHRTIIRSAERLGPGVLRQVFAAAGGRLDGSEELHRLVLKYPDLAADWKLRGDRDSGGASTYLGSVPLRQADLASPKQRAEIVAAYEHMPSATRDVIAAAVAASWARTEPDAAAAWALSIAQPMIPESASNQAAQLVFLRWIHTDRAAALRWFDSLPASPLRDALGANASTHVANDGDLEAAIALHGPGAENGAWGATAQLAQMVGARDPAAAGAWLAKLPEGSVDHDAVDYVVAKWYQRDPAAVGQWVESLPAGPRRDHAAKGIVEKALQEDAHAAAAWTRLINDRKLQQSAAADVYPEYSRADPARAVEWINSLEAVDEAWKGRFLRRYR